jgi:NTP pyrophosphatase (non-canonical NTP hydrolase)
VSAAAGASAALAAGAGAAPATSADPPDRLRRLEAALRGFAEERDWSQFHTPKNLAAALIVEAAELLEHFQWLTPKQSSELPAQTREAVAREMADVFLYLLRLAQVQGIDLLAAAEAKLADNARRYPPESSRGNCAKSNLP